AGLGGGAVGLGLQGVVMLLAFGAATLVVGRLALKLTAADLRWRDAGPPARGFIIGVGLGAAAALAAMLFSVAAGARWSPDAGTVGDYATQVGLTLLLLAPAALAEEVVFRGVPLVALSEATSRRTAVILTSLLFGVAHLTNPNVTALAILNIALAGVFLAAAFYAPGGIWTAWGAHLGWNGLLAALDAPVSGLPFLIPLLDYDPDGPAWLTGGSFGPEGGMLATLALALAIAFTARWARETRT
ncbi:MAG: CPBP family intramembrane metalloprotease, partial [Gemmatimonadota bacterium]|nr:CPBP family intramembrane metalloprotease [Gemmatimonadota bacterium]